MALHAPLRRQLRRVSRQSNPRSESQSFVSLNTEGSPPSTYVAHLWRWAADANRSRLSDITLAHVLSGNTAPPISLSDFEAFLAFCDISLENLQFIVWFQDYRARYDALPPDVQAQSPPLARSELQDEGSNVSHSVVSKSSHATSESSGPKANVEYKEHVQLGNSQGGSGSETHVHTLGRLVNAAQEFSPSALNLRTSSLDYPPPQAASVTRNIEGVDFVQELDLQSFDLYGAISPHSSATLSFAPSELSPRPLLLSSRLDCAPFSRQQQPMYPNAQPFRTEVQNILATFFVPGAKKELLLSSEMRNHAITESGRTTHPDVFLPAYESVYELTESVSLSRFLINASTNINRPRQLFAYFLALLTFLGGLALALWFILSPAHSLRVPAQSHRAWRLFSVPLFLSSGMLWYKGFRGLCPLVWFCSSTQLRAWELERMGDDEEAQAYCATLAPSKKVENTDGLPLTPVSTVSPISCTPLNSRIAPFLGEDVPVNNSPPAALFSTVSAASGSGIESENSRSKGKDFVHVPSRARNGFHRPPIFGPERVIEDARIRAVHTHLFLELMRFGLFWAAVFTAIVVSVPSGHVH
ncbi:hypothetical protein DFH11DRAFT_697950 [Phellopilus nigrolimitatus]|nr:hypothetical protein DFH11DRAFT_697950 [Phellopilus nigrolimitatus]